MGFSRPGYWSRLPFPFPEDLPDPGIKPGSPELQVDSLPSEPPGKSSIHISAYICIFVYTYTNIRCFGFPSPLSHHRALNRASYAIQILYINTYRWNLEKKNGTEEPICKAEIEGEILTQSHRPGR